ncbi:MAG: chemotaxis protein CheC, partial [Candidatus Gastranaerophilaceae bacterium]
MSNNLSQDEIDKLTKQATVKVETKELEYITATEADTLGEIGNISMGTSATTLSLLLGNKVEITTPSIL